VAVSTKPRIQLFSVAYRGSFDPSRPRARYLGDAGVCTNIARTTGTTLDYSVVVPAAARFVVEVEGCGESRGALPYVLDVAGAPGLRVRFAGARAERRGDDVLVRWRVAGAADEVAFAVYRERAGTRHISGRPRSIPGSRSFAYLDRNAATGRPPRYWIRASDGDGGWVWHGPLVADDR
jgi:hypothetical protein